MDKWSVYLVRCKDDSLYAGVALDVDRRLEEHREEKSQIANRRDGYARGVPGKNTSAAASCGHLHRRITRGRTHMGGSLLIHRHIFFRESAGVLR